MVNLMNLPERARIVISVILLIRLTTIGHSFHKTITVLNQEMMNLFTKRHLRHLIMVLISSHPRNLKDLMNLPQSTKKDSLSSMNLMMGLVITLQECNHRIKGVMIPY